MSNGILVEVKEIKQDDKLTHLCFIYQDKLIKPENTYEIFDDEDGRYIKKLYSLKQEQAQPQKHYLITSDTQIESRIESGDFKDCIFLMRANFQDAVFTEMVDFKSAIFTELANFQYTTFTKQADFWNATFTKQANFWNATFTEQADFQNATFIKQANFRHVIFTENADFSGVKFTKQAYFQDATFTKQANFWHAIFTEQANFLSITFTEQADFGGAEFIKQANFKYVTFTKQADFQYAIFTKQADFEGAIFTEQAIFLGAIFIKQANFRHATFTKQAYFEDVKFAKGASFKGVTFTEQAVFLNAKFSQNPTDFTQAQFLISLNFNGVDFINLNLHQSQLDKIYYKTSTTFNAPNRETFLILKSIALKQHDKVKALEFHTQEYEQHQKSNPMCNFFAYLWLAIYGEKNINPSDCLILGFEKWASYFGTSVIRSVLWYFGFATLFYWLMNGFNIDTKTIINFIIPIKIAVGDFLINDCPSSLDYVLFAFYKFGQIVLLYEIIKSFRKYSRVL